MNTVLLCIILVVCVGQVLSSRACHDFSTYSYCSYVWKSDKCYKPKYRRICVSTCKACFGRKGWCLDEMTDCAQYARWNYCKKYKGVKAYCRKSCKRCN